MLSQLHMGIPYEYTHIGRPICVWADIHVWANICICGRTWSLETKTEVIV